MIDSSISKYKILKKIASGGMANIYLALDTITNAKVAIKILKEEVSGKEKILDRFNQEGLLNLDHPNIVKILDAGVHENTPYIVMEYIEGHDLEELIKDKKRLAVNKALSIFIQLLSALSYVHNQKIIHRDIKPKNILIDKSGKVKLTDFGIAKSLYSHVKTSTGGYLGAPAYSSPEQMDGKPLDARSDIYSLGITLYEILTGVTPFSSKSIPNLIKEKFTGKYRRVSSYRSDVPSHIISVIDRCIAVNPKDRFRKVEEIVNAINKPEIYSTIIIEPKPKLANSIKKPDFITVCISISVIAAVMALIIFLAVKCSGNIAILTSKTSYTGTTVASTFTSLTSITETTSTITTLPVATVSPARNKIVFMSDRDGNAEIYTMNIDGLDPVRLTYNPAIDAEASFSPDGSKIAFYSDRYGDPEIFTMNIDGSEQTRLTYNPSIDSEPSFSPDGFKIIFHSNIDGNNEIYSMNIDGSEQTRLTNNSADDGNPSFSPDGSKIIFHSNIDGNYKIYIMNADGSGQKRLTNNKSIDWFPSFSPDGSKIIFVSERDGNWEIYKMNTDGSKQKRLTNSSTNELFPSYSPDGSKIAFESESYSNTEIYIMNVDGSEKVNLTNNQTGDRRPSFSP